MLVGLVKWFDLKKGFGVIQTPNKKEYFLQINNFLEKPLNLPPGVAVILINKMDKNKDRNTSLKARVVGEPEDLSTVFSNLDKSDTLEIEIETKSYNRRNKSYYIREKKSFSLLKVSIKQIFEGKKEDELIKIITEYFDNHLESKYFITFCEQLEDAIGQIFPVKVSKTIISELYEYFGKNINDDILFYVWKEKKFKYVSYEKLFNHEIPERVLLSNYPKLGIPELERILRYSYGKDFLVKFVNEKFRGLDIKPISDLKELYIFLKFISESERENWKSNLDTIFTERLIASLPHKVSKLRAIRTKDDLNNYLSISQAIPDELNVEFKNRIKSAVNEIIIQKCSDEFKVDLWINGIIVEVSLDDTRKKFLDKSSQLEIRLSILSKIELNDQFEFLKLISIEYDFTTAFNLLENLVKKENQLQDSFRLSKVLSEKDNLNDLKHGNLINLFKEYFNTHSSEKQKYELFFKGYIEDVPISIVYQNIGILDEKALRIIFESLPRNSILIKEILERKVLESVSSDFARLYTLANDFLGNNYFNLFDRLIFESIEQSEYFELWKMGRAKIFPVNYIEKFLCDNFDNYSQICDWITSCAINTEEIENFLLFQLAQEDYIIDRKTFYKQLNHIKYLLQINELNKEKIKQLQNDFYNIILWYLDKDEILDFKLLTQKFAFFKFEEQIRIVRKLFLLKAKGEFNLTVEKLNELTSSDFELHKKNINFTPELTIDISTLIIAKSLLSFRNNQHFIAEKDLFSIIFDDSRLNQSERFKLSNYFENCLGRMVSKINFKGTKGVITKVNFEKDKFYFAIKFDFNNKIVEGLKVFEKKRFYKDGNKYFSDTHWGVPSKYETGVFSFAKEHRFLLDYEGNKYLNNVHLAEFSREEIPNGITFCEGRLANRKHSSYNTEFYWCANQPCFSKCETIHSKREWENYTLLDFCEILGFNTDETNKMGDLIPKGHYYQFISLINRFNRLLEKLYCNDCNHILQPSDFGTSHFAAHSIVRFQCRNNACLNNDEIYLNHCLNGHCNSIIDSRVSERCNNGLFICNNCGTCCSHNMFEKRLSNLTLTGGFIPEKLKKCLNEKLGHLERAEYFCHKCKEEMSEISRENFECTKCNVKYDTAKYKIKRPHLHLRKTIALKENNRYDEGDLEF